MNTADAHRTCSLLLWLSCPVQSEFGLCGSPAAPVLWSLLPRGVNLSLTCSVLFWSCPPKPDMDTGQMLFQRSLEGSLEIFLLTRWNSLQFSNAALEMWEDKLCWESASNFPKRYWPQLQSSDGVMVWEAVLTATLFFLIPGEVLYLQVLCVYNFPISPHLPTWNLSDPVLLCSCLWALLIPAGCFLSTAQGALEGAREMNKSIPGTTWSSLQSCQAVAMCAALTFSHQTSAQCKCETGKPHAQSQLWKSILRTNEQPGFYLVYWSTATRSNKLVRGSTAVFYCWHHELPHRNEWSSLPLSVPG